MFPSSVLLPTIETEASAERKKLPLILEVHEEQRASPRVEVPDDRIKMLLERDLPAIAFTFESGGC